MKTFIFTIALIVTASTYGKEVPSPFWFSISEKILNETHLLINPDAKDISVKPAVKVRPNAKSVKQKQTLKCEPKEEISFPNPMSILRGSGIWMLNDME